MKKKKRDDKTPSLWTTEREPRKIHDGFVPLGFDLYYYCYYSSSKHHS